MPSFPLFKNELRSRNIEYEGASVDGGGNFGYRHQFNIADLGTDCAPVVTNDRAGEVGRTLDIREFDIDRIFGKVFNPHFRWSHWALSGRNE